MIFLCFLVLMLFLAGCGLVARQTGSTSSTPGVVSYKVFTFTAPALVNSERLAWSSDGNWIGFQAGYDIYRVSKQPNSTPVKVTSANTSTFEGGGYRVGFLADGRVVYYYGWIDGTPTDRNMHFMAASSAQVENVPSPSVLHAFNGNMVGMGTDVAATPENITLSGTGDKAIINWNSTPFYGLYLLDWSSGTLNATALNYLNAFISPEGDYIAFIASPNLVGYRPVGSGTETILGAGSDVSWAANGVIGYVSNAGYIRHDINQSATVAYQIPDGLLLQNVVINGTGDKIAYRWFDMLDSGVAVGELRP